MFERASWTRLSSREKIFVALMQVMCYILRMCLFFGFGFEGSFASVPRALSTAAPNRDDVAGNERQKSNKTQRKSMEDGTIFQRVAAGFSLV